MHPIGSLLTRRQDRESRKEMKEDKGDDTTGGYERFDTGEKIFDRNWFDSGKKPQKKERLRSLRIFLVESCDVAVLTLAAFETCQTLKPSCCHINISHFGLFTERTNLSPFTKDYRVNIHWQRKSSFWQPAKVDFILINKKTSLALVFLFGWRGLFLHYIRFLYI